MCVCVSAAVRLMKKIKTANTNITFYITDFIVVMVTSF